MCIVKLRSRSPVRSRSCQVPGQVQKVQGLRAKDLDLGLGEGLDGGVGGGVRGGLQRGLQRGLITGYGRGLAVKLRSGEVQVRSGPGLDQFTAQIYFF